MAKSAVTLNAVLQLLFQNANFAGVGDATGLRGSTSAGSLFVGLHIADPKTGGAEVNYAEYIRVPVARSAAGWTVNGLEVSNTAKVTFPKRDTDGPVQRAEYFSIYSAATGGVLIGSEVLGQALDIGLGVTPEFDVGQLVSEFVQLPPA